MANPGRGQIHARGLVKTFRVGTDSFRAVDGVDLDIDSGSSIAIMGASGSGKSTLLHLLGGMSAADAGTLRVGDQVVTRLTRRQLTLFRREVGFVFQRFHLLPALTVLDNVIAPLIVGSPPSDRTRRAVAALEQVGLADRAHAMPHELSGGQQQRVAVARAIVVQPRLILADEPTGNLDSANSAMVMSLLHSLQARIGTTLVVATHDPTIAATCGSTIMLRDGRIVDSPG